MYNSYLPVQNLIFVSEDEARNYNIPPSSKVLLMSKDSSKFWIKTSDSWGQTTLDTYSFKKEEPAPPVTASQYITKDDLARFKDELLALITSPKEVTDNAKSDTTEPATTAW